MGVVLTFLHQGGWVMWPLIVLFIITIGIILERIITYRKIVSVHPEEIIEEIREVFPKEGGLKKSIAIVEEVKTPYGRIFLRGLKNATRSGDSIDLAMSQEAGNELPTLENYLPGLKTIVGIAPLLGLLGTIAGMIISFKEVAAHGLSSPTAVMSGVSEALISTATGIGIAIIALIFYNYFASLVKKYIEDIEYYGAELTNIITGRIS